MSEYEKNDLEKVLAAHTAPALLGVKCANLVSVAINKKTVTEYLAATAENAAAHGLKMVRLCQCRERTLVYVYHEKLLKAWLDAKDMKEFLMNRGYPKNGSVKEMLDVLASRMNCGNFPHEIGAFLGYPLEDIRGFIHNRGRNCLLCGPWKVYSDVEHARELFRKYDRCRELLCNGMEQGLDLFQALSLSSGDPELKTD